MNNKAPLFWSFTTFGLWVGMCLAGCGGGGGGGGGGTPTVLTVTTTIPTTLSTTPAFTSASSSPLIRVTSATLGDSGGASYTAAGWTAGNGSVTVTFNNVTNNNLPFTAGATVQLLDQAGTWHTLMTATASAQTLGSSGNLVLANGGVGNLTIGTSNLGSLSSGTWPTSWGVTATVGGTQATFSPTLFAAGTPSLTGTALTGTWPSITAATLTSNTSPSNGSVSIPITFNNGAGSNPTGAVTATITPNTGNGSGTIN